jgi:hypothetical protein
MSAHGNEPSSVWWRSGEIIAINAVMFAEQTAENQHKIAKTTVPNDDGFHLQRSDFVNRVSKEFCISYHHEFLFLPLLGTKIATRFFIPSPNFTKYIK